MPGPTTAGTTAPSHRQRRHLLNHPLQPLDAVLKNLLVRRRDDADAGSGTTARAALLDTGDCADARVMMVVVDAGGTEARAVHAGAALVAADLAAATGVAGLGGWAVIEGGGCGGCEWCRQRRSSCGRRGVVVVVVPRRRQGFRRRGCRCAASHVLGCRPVVVEGLSHWRGR